MKKALVELSGRIAQVVEAEQEFPVHASLVWRDCDDDVTPETHYFIGENISLNLISPLLRLTATQLNPERDLERAVLRVREIIMRLPPDQAEVLNAILDLIQKE